MMDFEGIPGLTSFVYGTTRLGDGALPVEQRVAVARAAMEAGWALHTSTQYGDALPVLRRAFDQDRARVPTLICKIAGDSLDAFRESVHSHIDVLGVDHLDVGQLCIGGAFAEGVARGEGLDIFRRLRDEGLVRRFVWEVFPWASEAPLRALDAGNAAGLVSAFIFYLNPLQRFASNRLWDALRERKAPIIAMRTVAGGNVHRLRDVPGAAWLPYLQERATEVAPVFERSGEGSWARFCVRFAHSLPGVLSTVGSTGRLEGVREFLLANAAPLQPLPQDVMHDLLALQRRWADAVDAHAEPWTM